MTKKLIVFLFGIALVSFGLALLIRADLGMGSVDALCVGLSQSFGLTTGLWMVLINLIFILICSILNKERFDLKSALSIFILGICLDTWLYLLSIHPTALYAKIGHFALGMLIVGLGVAIYTRPKLAVAPLDKLMFTLSNVLKMRIFLARTLIEGIACLLALWAHGPISIGTLVFSLSIGILIQFFIARLGKK